MDRSAPPDEAGVALFWAMSDDLFAMVDATGHLVRFNDAWSRVLGWDHETIAGAPLADLAHPRDRPRFARELARLQDAPGTQADLDIRFRTARDDHRDLDMHLEAVSDTQPICLVAHDITARHQAQRARDASEQRFRSAMEHAPIGMALIDLDGHWFRVNVALCELLGRDADALTGAVVEDITHPDDLAASHAQMGPLLAGERDAYAFEKRYLHADGHVVDAAVTVSLVRDEADAPLYVIGQIVDITQRKRTEERLRATVAELKDANEALENFALIASHDLKSPLAAVQGLLATTIERPEQPLSDRDRDLLGRALDQTASLASSVDGLLALSRARTQALARQPVNLAELLDDVARILEHDITAVGATIHHGDLPTVEGDATLLRLLVQNLVANALKFRCPDRPPVLEVDAARQGAWWRITFSDNGRGFAPGDAEAIFELFGRTGDGRRIDGAGIGLATCRKILERHGGTIHGEPRDRGARFVVHLPAVGRGSDRQVAAVEHDDRDPDRDRGQH